MPNHIFASAETLWLSDETRIGLGQSHRVVTRRAVVGRKVGDHELRPERAGRLAKRVLVDHRARVGEDDVEPVYTVRFSSVDLFGDQTDAGEPPYVLLIDLWEPYLEAP